MLQYLLDIFRYEAGDLTLHLRPISIKEPIAAAISDARLFASESEITVQVEEKDFVGTIFDVRFPLEGIKQ